MKNILLIICTVCCLFAATSCHKVTVLDIDDFSVSTEVASIQAGDTLKFNLTGNPDIILFYSGEAGRNYDSAKQLTMLGSPKIVFQSAMQQGSLPNQDSLKLMVVKNLPAYDSATIVNANWVDITNRNKSWPTTLSTTYTTSDSIDISDFSDADSINIAFKFTGKKYGTPRAQQRKWQIQGFTLTNCLSGGVNIPIFSTFFNTGWFQLNVKNNPLIDTVDATKNAQAWNVGEYGINANNAPLILQNGSRKSACNKNGIAIQTAYPISFNPGSGTNVDDNEDWLITSAANLKYARQISVPVKSTVMSRVTRFRYVFKFPGVYQVAFVAQNQKLNIKKEVVKRLTVTVN